ncbi:MAG: hypothetical protein K0S76_1594 [Herbinix sp.]|jgi:hypothetical protein|nr:hypothetical protein [Herbinix sp.]
MDINNSLSRLKTTGKSVKSGLRTESKLSTDVSKTTDTRIRNSKSNVDATPLEWKEGQIIKGEVVDLRFNEVTIRLEYGRQITAKLEGDIPLSIGQTAQFYVTEVSPEIFSIKYIPSELKALTNQTIEKALLESKLPLTERNKAIVDELLNHRMPIDKQTLQTLAKLSITNREASPLTLVLMLKNNLPMTKENIAQYESYQRGTHQLLRDITNIAGNISDLYEQASNMQPKELAALNRGVLDILYRPQTNHSEPSSTNAPFLELFGDEASSLNNKTPGSNLISDPTASLSSKTDLYTQIHREQVLPKESTDRTFFGPSDIANENIRNAEYRMNLLTLKETLTSQERTSLLDLMKAFPGLEELETSIKEGSLPVKDLLNFIQASLSEQIPDSTPPLFSAPSYLKLLEEAFHSKWTITPEELSHNSSIDKLYQSLQEDMKELNEFLQVGREAMDPTHLKEPVKNMQDNLEFMRNLNEVFTYLQLPVQLKDKDVHGDLYIYTKKDAFKGKKDGLSVLLHLEMQNLGPVNIHIHMDHNQVHANFSLESEEAGQLIAKHLQELTETLEKKGYSFHAKIEPTYVKPDFSKDFIEQNNPDSNVMRYSFDIRT